MSRRPPGVPAAAGPPFVKPLPPKPLPGAVGSKADQIKTLVQLINGIADSRLKPRQTGGVARAVDTTFPPLSLERVQHFDDGRGEGADFPHYPVADFQLEVLLAPGSALFTAGRAGSPFRALEPLLD